MFLFFLMANKYGGWGRGYLGVSGVTGYLGVSGVTVENSVKRLSWFQHALHTMQQSN